MYLGMVLALFAWAVYLSSIWSLLGPVVFALYITRFHLVPEERVLDRLFGATFAEYKKQFADGYKAQQRAPPGRASLRWLTAENRGFRRWT